MKKNIKNRDKENSLFENSVLCVFWFVTVLFGTAIYNIFKGVVVEGAGCVANGVKKLFTKKAGK